MLKHFYHFRIGGFTRLSAHKYNTCDLFTVLLQRKRIVVEEMRIKFESHAKQYSLYEITGPPSLIRAFKMLVTLGMRLVEQSRIIQSKIRAKSAC